MTKKPYVVVVMTGAGTLTGTTQGMVVYSARFVTKEAASAAAEFWSLRGAAAVIEDWRLDEI